MQSLAEHLHAAANNLQQHQATNGGLPASAPAWNIHACKNTVSCIHTQFDTVLQAADCLDRLH